MEGTTDPCIWAKPSSMSLSKGLPCADSSCFSMSFNHTMACTRCFRILYSFASLATVTDSGLSVYDLQILSFTSSDNRGALWSGSTPEKLYMNGSWAICKERSVRYVKLDWKRCMDTMIRGFMLIHRDLKSIPKYFAANPEYYLVYIAYTNILRFYCHELFQHFTTLEVAPGKNHNCRSL